MPILRPFPLICHSNLSPGGWRLLSAVSIANFDRPVFIRAVFFCAISGVLRCLFLRYGLGNLVLFWITVPFYRTPHICNSALFPFGSSISYSRSGRSPDIRRSRNRCILYFLSIDNMRDRTARYPILFLYSYLRKF